MVARADRRLRLACLINAPIIIAALATGRLGGDLLQLFVADVARLDPSAIGAVYIILVPVSFVQMLVLPRLVRAKSLHLVQRAFIVSALGSTLILLGGWAPPGAALALLAVGVLANETAISMGWVPGWWPLVTRACGPDHRRAVATVRSVTQLSTVGLLVAIGLLVGDQMSRTEGTSLLLLVTAYFLSSALLVGHLDTGQPEPSAPQTKFKSGGMREAFRRPTEDMTHLLRTYVVPTLVARPFLLATLLLVRFDVGAGTIAMLLGAARLASLAGAYASGINRLTVRASTLAALWCCIIGSTALAVAVIVGPRLVGIAAVVVLCFAGADSVLMSVGISEATSRLKDTDSPRYFVLEDVIGSVSVQVGAGVAGVLLSQSAWTVIGYPIMLFAGAAWCLRIVKSVPASDQVAPSRLASPCT